MKAPYIQKAPKKSIDLTINSGIQTRAKEPNINFSSTLEATIPRQVLSGRHERQWKIENRTAIQTYNDFVQDNGCFSDEYRNLNTKAAE